MKKKFLWIIIFFVLILLVTFCLFNFKNSSITEKVIIKNDIDNTESDYSGELRDYDIDNTGSDYSGELRDYDVDIEDNEITFTSRDGKEAIIYSFYDNHLDNITYITVGKSEEEANYIKGEYEKRIGDGIIGSVKTADRMIMITYDKNYFKDYEQYTQSEIQDMLINDEGFSTIIDDE